MNKRGFCPGRCETQHRVTSGAWVERLTESSDDDDSYFGRSSGGIAIFLRDFSSAC